MDHSEYVSNNHPVSFDTINSLGTVLRSNSQLASFWVACGIVLEGALLFMLVVRLFI